MTKPKTDGRATGKSVSSGKNFRKTNTQTQNEGANNILWTVESGTEECMETGSQSTCEAGYITMPDSYESENVKAQDITMKDTR